MIEKGASHLPAWLLNNVEEVSSQKSVLVAVAVLS